ncbi:hypothetical protein KKC13_03850 [bacterium]|nr:hypothetical protein [bacterium]MBU1957354.1 hypothetical protein [bacterium]
MLSSHEPKHIHIRNSSGFAKVELETLKIEWEELDYHLNIESMLNASSKQSVA